MRAMVLLQVAASTPPSSGYGAAVLQALFALAAVCVLAWAVLRWGARSGFASFGSGKRVTVLERVPLDGRRTLFVLRVGDRVLLVGAGNEGPPALLATLDASEVPEPEAPRSGFADVIAKVRGQRAAQAATAPEKHGDEEP